MTWLIVGSRGQLGTTLQAELSLRKIPFSTLNSSQLDITKPQEVERLISLLKPSIIVNAAAWTDVDAAETHQFDTYSVNADGPRNLAIAAKSIRSKFVQISTDYVFSGQASVQWSENANRNPESVYGKSKSDGEAFVQEFYPEGSYIVRTAWLYSAHRRNFAKTMTKLVMNGNDKIRVINDQYGQPTYAADLAKQITDLILTNTHFGIYHATNAGKATWFDFAQEICKLIGEDVSRIIPVESSVFPRPAKRPTYSVLAHDAWAKTAVPVMRDWRIALAEAMPAIISAVDTER
jgi:dTDP-4-dehydrorhamnose reductase